MIFYQVKLNGEIMFLVEQEFADCYNNCELISIINMNKYREYNKCVKLSLFTNLLNRCKNNILNLNLYHKNLTVDEIIDKTNELKINNFISNFILHDFFELGTTKDFTYIFKLDNLKKIMYDFIDLDKHQKYINLFDLSETKDLSYKDIYNLLSDNEKLLLKKNITEYIGVYND
jgi:hypothetical protein